MKDIGLVGVPFSGKSTLFTALTRTGSHGGQANHAVVPVPDPRLAVLTEIERSRKTVQRRCGSSTCPADVERARDREAPRGRTRSRSCSAASAPTRSPRRELAEVRADLLLADQAVDRARAGKAAEAARRASRPPRSTRSRGRTRRWRARLRCATPASSPRSSRELKAIAPLTLKPEVVVANLEEGTEVPAGLPEGAVGVYASIEAETAEMDPDEARALLDEFGVHEPGLET